MIVVCLGDSLTEGDYGISGKRGIANENSFDLIETALCPPI